jgi:predicted naringenin-chalcone synthase
MPAFLTRIATQQPAHEYEQDHIRERMKAWSTETKTRRLIHTIYQRSGIKRRASVLADFHDDAVPELYGTRTPGTAARNRLYSLHARPLAAQAARKVLQGADPAEVSHVIYVSCTGFANPGPDFHLIQELGLRADVQRYTLGFMGCYAAFPALRMAAQFCEANAAAVVLVVCLELCTLHMQLDDRPDNILANSLFADGCAAAVVRGQAPREPCLVLRGFESALLPSSEAEMAWDIGDDGFHIVLSGYVPGIIGANVRALIEGVLQRHGGPLIDHWAVHPGGRSILEKVAQSLVLPPEALAVSRDVLSRHGNMSSATILHVLQEMLATHRGMICAMAFGPGLTVETALLERVGA